MDTNKNCLYVKINDNSYIDKLKSTFALIKQINPEVLINFLNEKNQKGQEENIIEINISGSIENAINVYVKHVLSADNKNFKCINNINKTKEITINIKTEEICEFFKAFQSNALLSMYMYNEFDTLYLQEQVDKTTIEKKIQTLEKKYGMQNTKINIKENTIKARVIINTEKLCNLLKKRFKKSASCISIRLTKDEIRFETNNSSSMQSISSPLSIVCQKSNDLNIEILDKNIEIIQSNYSYESLEFLKNVKFQYYVNATILFAKLKSNTKNDNYVMQFVYSGAGEKINDDIIKITVYPCLINDQYDQYDNNNQIEYN